MRHLLLSSLVALVSTSCIRDKAFTIYTNPEGAEVTINGERHGVTPVTTKVHQDRDLGIVVRKEGYEPTSTTIVTRPHWFMSFVWTQNDPRAQYIEEDEVTIPMTRIPTLSTYKPSELPAFDGKTFPEFRSSTKHSKSQGVPALRPMPDDI